ncbi:hypothetical protein BLOT_000622 [Blomia tropicalis]|nr:hypothetical protein BLOT_000622 [Blomia tropicalis]
MTKNYSKNLIGAIDQGTSSSRFLIFSAETGELVTYHQVEIKKIYPHEGWVEQNPIEICRSVYECIDFVANRKLPSIGFSIDDIRCVGLTNQRESTILWDKITGEPLYNSIVWLDNRTSDLVETLITRIPGRDINWLKAKTGLPISTYFSALKIKWLIDNVPAVQTALNQRRLMFGTVDSWLLWNLTGGIEHLTDVTNASRTLLMDLETLDWDPHLCDFFSIPRWILPKIKSSADMFGKISKGPLSSIPVTGMIGDQNAALVGQRCLSLGQTKVTYGTGAFLMQNIGPGPLHGALKNVPKEARRKLLTTIAYKLGDAPAWYALEGSIAIAGAAITWLRDNLELIDNYTEVEEIARSDETAGGLFFVPAFQGLYAPYWDANATGTIIGISQFSRKCHLIRATLEGVAFQTNDIIELMRSNDAPNHGVRVDGGMSSNDLLCQILADITGGRILRPKMTESTALGAAMIASYTCGLWNTFVHDTDASRKNSVIANSLSSGQPVEMITSNGHLVGETTKKNNSVVEHSNTTSNGNDNIKLHLSFKSPSSSSSNISSEDENEHNKIELGSEQIQNPEWLDIFHPTLVESVRLERVNRWCEAIGRSRKWIRIESQVQKRVDYLRWSTLPLTAFILVSFGMVILSKNATTT